MSRSVLLLSAALLAATPPLVRAGELVPRRPEAASGAIVFAGLDLSTPAGIAEARRRLTLMSERLCRRFRDDRKVDDWETYVDCVHDTLASALERIRTSISTVAVTQAGRRDSSID
jgi:UrcA family protein